MKILLLILSSFFIIGCAGTAPTSEEVIHKTTKKQNFNQPKQWKISEDNGTVNTSWIKTFNDPTLENFVKEALENNKQIRVFQAKIETSDALVKKAASALKPTIGLGVDYKNKETDYIDEIYGGGLTVNWEADVWGRLQLGVNAQESQLQAQQYDYEFARQILVSSIAKAWFMTTSTRLQMNYSKSIVALFDKELEIMNLKYKIGKVDKRSVYLSKANLSLAKNAFSKAQIAYEDAQRSLELLLGRYPASIIEGTNKLVALPIDIPIGLPSQLLERRPDILAAEQRVAEAFYKQKESKLLHLPRFNFSIGALANNISNAITSLSAGIFAPLYTGGAIEAEVKKATAIQKQRIEEYAQTVLEAFKEVENHLSREVKLQEQENYLNEVVKDNQKALQLTKVLFEVGKVEYLEVSQVQNKLISAQISLLDIKSQRLFNRVNLHLALGGGFDK